LSAPDPEIWGYGIEHDAALISEDEDFPDRARLGGEAPVVVWVRVGNTTRQALLDWFDPLLDRVITMRLPGSSWKFADGHTGLRLTR
jgi:predicted nuclease of predicted toxin-antitoxin system